MYRSSLLNQLIIRYDSQLGSEVRKKYENTMYPREFRGSEVSLAVHDASTYVFKKGFSFFPLSLVNFIAM